jgi:hypothetical protein
MSTSVSVPADRRSPSDADWMIPASLFVLAQYGFAVLVSARIGYAVRPPVVTYIEITMFFASIIAVSWLLFALFRMYRRGEARPAQRLVQLAKEHWHAWLLILGGFVLISVQMGALTWLKAMLPFAVPFWADPMLAATDRLVLGTDAWRLFHPLLEPIDPVIDWGYTMWFPLHISVLFLALSRAASFEKSRTLLAYFLTIGLFGVIGQYALSSAGPIFYGRLGLGNQFSRLPISAAAQKTSDYLWATRQDMNAAMGGGISAMPSVHVAVSVWMAIACWSLLPRLAAFLAAAFALLIFVGSMYLGWHYFVDAAAGVVAGATAWALAGLYLRRGREWLGGLRPASPLPDYNAGTSS